MTLRVLKSWRYIVGFLRNTLLLERVHIPPWEYRKIIDSNGWEGISQSQGIEIPAVLCPKAGQSKKNKASWFRFSFKFYGFLFKYVPPQHHVHPFGWNSGATLPHAEKLNLWICLSEFDPETSSHWLKLKDSKFINHDTILSLFHPKKSNKDYLDLLRVPTPTFFELHKKSGQPPIPIPPFPFKGHQCQMLIRLIFQLHSTCPDRRERPKTSLPNLGDTHRRRLGDSTHLRTLRERWYGFYVLYIQNVANVLLNICIVYV